MFRYIENHSSWTWSTILVSSFATCSVWCILIIANFIISAAVPWIGVLMATRSALLAVRPLRELISLKTRLLPIKVNTYPFSFANWTITLHSSLILEILKVISYQFLDSFLEIPSWRRQIGCSCTVGDRKIDSFSISTLVLGDFIIRNIVHLGGSRSRWKSLPDENACSNMDVSLLISAINLSSICE